MGVDVRCYTPDRASLLASFTERDLSGCTLSAQRPGGCAAMTVRFVPELVPYTLLSDHPYTHWDCTVDGVLLWDGRCANWNERGLYITDLTANGYYFTGYGDHPYSSESSGAVTIGTYVRDLTNGYAPALEVAASELYDDPGVSVTPSDYSGQMPDEVMQALTKQAGGASTPVDYFVFPGGTLEAHYRLPPDTADYWEWRGLGRVTRSPDWRSAYGGVSVDFSQHAAGTATVGAAATSQTVSHNLGTTPGASEITLRPTSAGLAKVFQVQNRSSSTFDIVTDVVPGGTGAIVAWDIKRQRVPTSRNDDPTWEGRTDLPRTIRLHGGDMTNVAAEAWRDNELAKRSRPLVPSKLTIPRGMGMFTPNGAIVPGMLVRCDQWYWVEGDMDQAGNRILSPILRWQYDTLSGVTTIEGGAPIPGYATEIRTLRDSDAAMRGGYEVLSGGRRT